ncbi:hypothetical protein IG631_03212 [Alternaria alternata]|nr:hypothetical protein IG631_03212 [Alternaria alternata]
MPDMKYSQPLPTASVLHSFTPTMRYYDTMIDSFQRHLAIEQDIVAMLPTEHARKVAYEQKMAVLDTAKAKLRELVDFSTETMEKQIEKPDTALGLSAERANEQIQNGLKEVEDAMAELRYQMWEM